MYILTLAEDTAHKRADQHFKKNNQREEQRNGIECAHTILVLVLSNF